MKKINRIHRAVSAPIDDLVTYRALPTRSLQMGDLDPFLFLNHHGPQTYPAPNRGLPFGPHPHRGFETVTFILEGDIVHKDTGGHESVIQAGGIQWMTAGSGLIHAEVSSAEFKKQGGPLEILQLWVNLPARHKMTPPHYVGLQQADIPSLSLQEGAVTINLIAGTLAGERGPIQSLGEINLASISFRAGGTWQTRVPALDAVFFYVVRGEVTVNGQPAAKLHLVEFSPEGEEVQVEASTDSLILFGHATPFGEPIVAYGPFVMNSEEEIRKAYQDYQEGKYGVWKD